MDIRQALVAFVAATQDLVDVFGTRVYPGIRPQGEEGTCLVYRVAKTERGETLEADSNERVSSLELVTWARGYKTAMDAKAVLEPLFHGTTGYQMGDIEIDGSRIVDEYDGDRVTDSYSDGGDYAITTVVEFQYLA